MRGFQTEGWDSMVRCSSGRSVPDRYSGSTVGPHPARCDHSDPVHRTGNKGDPAVLVCLRDLSQVGSYDWATPVLAHLYHGVDVWTRVSGESNWQFIWPLELLLTPWEGEAWRTYPAHRVAELYTRSRLLLRGYWLDRYFLGERVYELQVPTAQRRVPQAPPRHMCLLEGMTREDLEAEYEGSPADTPLSAGDYGAYFSTRLQARLPELWKYTQVPAQRYQELCRRFGLDLEIGRLQRHQSRQSGAVARLQLEVDRLRTRLEVEGILLDFSEDEEDDDGSSSDDAPPSPPPSSSCWSQPEATLAMLLCSYHFLNIL
ncbi:hypothetical protein JCGZ_15234 [Jatropha curcas]|uniref:Aminotransferase-like plant mobile domain-containing protein n=1 Tax=Jatropha curcas TaxID=180498 RepID=A0A067KHI9_JATCU|nr:hypothetical protein JCGZ_15234 [Jatropha curcas]